MNKPKDKIREHRNRFVSTRIWMRWYGLPLTLITLLLLVWGCGGGGGASGSGSPSITVQISPSTATIVPGGTKTFSATVTGSVNIAVVWSCVGGNIDQAGNYTAPTQVGTYSVTATSEASSSAKATAVITVAQSSSVAVTISPTSQTTTPGGQVQFSATVTGTTNTAVTWSTTLGTITNTGLFTAPNVATSCTVTATSVAAPTVSANATVSVQNVGVQISPGAPSIGTHQTVQFSATVSNEANQAVTWSATGGTITSGGLYQAGETPGTFSVTATSVADPSASSTVGIKVNAITVSVKPNTVTIVTNQTQQFVAGVNGTGNTAVTWTTTGGTISSTGLFTAPATAGTITVTATSTADPTASGTATLTVVTPSTFFYNFNSGVPAVWSPTTNESTPSGIPFLGRLSGTNSATLTLDSLTPHSTITVTFDLYVIGAWTGITGTSTLGVTIGGTSAFSQSFSNVSGDLQSYPLSGSNAPGTGSTGENTLGYTSDPTILYNDSTYHISCNAAHTASSVTIVFTGNLTGTLTQMAWGLKNVQVTANP